MITKPCRGCGKPVVWGETKDGKKIPLDPTPPVYKQFIDEFNNVWLERCFSELTRRPTAMVSHFATCKAANQFSGIRKKDG